MGLEPRLAGLKSNIFTTEPGLFIWRAPWKNQTSQYISFFRPSLNGVLFPMFCLLVEGECQILVF